MEPSPGGEREEWTRIASTAGPTQINPLCQASNFWDIGKECRPRSDAAEHHGLHCLLTGIYIRNKIKMTKRHQTPLNLEMDASN